MTHAKNLDNASGKLFLIGFIATKLRLIPIPFLSTILGFISSICYLIGYALWLIACHFYPDQAPKKEAWYGFSQIKNQHRITAVLGFVGIALCLLSFAFPALLLPGAAIFAISNIVWSIAEYHKRQNPPNDASYSPARQNYYVSYAILSTLVSVISAAALALTIICPPAGVAALFISSLLGFVLTVAAFYFLLSTPLPPNEHVKPRTAAITGSTAIISKQLAATNHQQPDSKRSNQSAQEPAPHQQLFPTVAAKNMLPTWLGSTPAP